LTFSVHNSGAEASCEIVDQGGWSHSVTPGRDTDAILDFDRLHAAILGLREKQIFFIGGPVKSGTTWLQLLLNAHPEISCGGEGHFINHLAPLLKTAIGRHCELIRDKNTSIFREIEGYPVLNDKEFLYILASCISIFMIEQSKHKMARAVGEKTPDNVRHFHELGVLFPTAKFIHIVRDGRDCAVSNWFHNERVTPGWVKQQFGTLEAFAYMLAGKWVANLDLAQEFADRYPDRFRQVRYEDLVADTKGALAGLFAFLGAESSESLLGRCRDAATFAKLSGGRSPGDEDRGSFFRTGVPGDWRRHLSDEAATRYRERAGRWLDRLGYT
jgi:Sulfotransferase family